MNLGVLFYCRLKDGLGSWATISSIRRRRLRCDLSLWNARLRCRRTGFCLGDRVAYVSTTKGVLYSQQSESQSFVILVSRRERGRKLLCARIINYVRSEYISGGQSRLAHSSMSLFGWQRLEEEQNRRGKGEKMCASVIDRLSSEMVLSDSLISHWVA